MCDRKRGILPNSSLIYKSTDNLGRSKNFMVKNNSRNESQRMTDLFRHLWADLPTAPLIILENEGTADATWVVHRIIKTKTVAILETSITIVGKLPKIVMI